MNHRHTLLIFLAYLTFVVYGSLVPFEYRDYPLDKAISAFADITYLDLGVASRADWVANIVLYLPLAFLACVWLGGIRQGGLTPYLAPVGSLILCLTVLVAVEFTQIFFAPRTVSLNDLLAETLGVLGGIALWIFGRNAIAQLQDAFIAGGRPSVVAASIVYALLYIALSLFPYDFIVSADELAWKIATGHQGWLIAGDCTYRLRCIAQWVGEALIIAPLGILMALTALGWSRRRVFTSGLVFGLVLELLQLLIVSGTSQGLSVLLRGIGLTGGFILGQAINRSGAAPIARFIAQATPFAVMPYLGLLTALAGWFSAPWLSIDVALARLADARFMPFYYHYFSTEPAAMASLLANAGMYAPVGLALWARQAVALPLGRRSLSSAAVLAMLLALCIELGKLWVPIGHPDFTNLLIAASSAALTTALAGWIERVLAHGRSVHRSITQIPLQPTIRQVGNPSPHPFGAFISISALLVLGFGVAHYPLAVAGWVVVLLVYAVLLWQRLWLWVFIIPMLLPVLDLSPFTGRLLLDEFDWLVLVTLAVGYWRIYPMRPVPWSHRSFSVALFLLWLSWGIASARGLWPLLTWEDGWTAGSHSPLETWQVGKGLLWALLLVPLLRRTSWIAENGIPRLFLRGIVAGLTIVIFVVIWERHVFVGLGDFDNVFRVTGTFSSMNTGGAYIETFIAFAFPALAVAVLLQRQIVVKLAGLLLVALTTYAMLVTFSRGGYAGLVIGLMVVAWGMLWARMGTLRHRGLAFSGLVVVTIAVAIPVLSGQFAQYRLARAAEDLAFRESRWVHTLSLMDDGVLTALTGMGFGQYPTRYLFGANTERLPGTYRIQHEGSQTYLRLGVGGAVYLDQWVKVQPGEHYQLSARVRRLSGEGSLTIALCEKALLYSFDCLQQRLEPTTPDAVWDTVTVTVAVGRLGGGGHWPYRPVKLSLYNIGPHRSVDVDDVRFTSADGRELLVNGDFSAGVNRWLFVADPGVEWHIDQQWLEVYFAQGLLGVLALVLLLFSVARVLWPAVVLGNAYATAFAGALIAFLTVGLLCSTVDTARLSMLFYLGAIVSGLLGSQRHPPAKAVVGSAND